MSILDKLANDNTKNLPSQSNIEEFSLSRSEIELLLNIIKDCSFRGDVLELLYSTVIKLQQQYLNQQ